MEHEIDIVRTVSVCIITIFWLHAWPVLFATNLQTLEKKTDF